MLLVDYIYPIIKNLERALVLKNNCIDLIYVKLGFITEGLGAAIYLDKPSGYSSG